jgi:hypothetical protein
VFIGFKRKASDAWGSSISKDKDNAGNAAPQSSSTTADLSSGNPYQTKLPATIARQETNGGVAQAEGNILMVVKKMLLLYLVRTLIQLAIAREGSDVHHKYSSTLTRRPLK